ncbi:hypothetical protein VPH35_102803 [Triticum aestivum]
MDLLEVFLKRRIQPLQARDHPMWLYSGLEDTTRIHPEEVTDEMLEGWLSSITGNKDNPRGARRVIPLDSSYEVDQATTEMYSTPNGAQGSTEEGEGSGGESGDDQGEWESDGEGEGGDDIFSSEEEEEEVEPPPPPPPRPERRSKIAHDPTQERGKVTASVGPSSKCPRTSSPTPTGKVTKPLRKTLSKPPKALPKMKIAVPTISGAATSEVSAKDDDQEMGDAVTSNHAPPHVIDLPDDDDNEPLRMRRTKRSSADRTPQPTPAPETMARDGGDAPRASVTFANPLSSAQPLASTVDLTSLFVAYPVPEDEVAAVKEAIRQAGVMMEQVKKAREASQAAYDASSALQSNVQKSCELASRYTELEKQRIQLNLDLELARTELQKVRDGVAGELSEALAKKDRDLAAAHKEADDKIALAEQKLASVSQIEDENTRPKTALNEANRECSLWKKENLSLSEQMEGVARRRDDLESYLRSLAKMLYIKLEEFCQNFEEETGQIETGLDPINSPVNDDAAMNLLRLESRIDGAMDYLAQLKVAMSRIDPTLWPESTLQNDLESLMTRLDRIPDRVQEWKKSSARCGADVALSLVRVHCKEA